MEKDRPSRTYLFGDFELNPVEQRLSRSGARIHLRPKTFDVLVLLVENHGHLVDRQTFFDTLWRQVEVTDDALTRCIKEIRECLGDTRRPYRYVRTVPKRGYAFVHAVREMGPQRQRSGASSRGTDPSPTAVSLAVLPFVDMSPAGDHEYLCDGIAEEILTALSKLDGLHVVARTSAFAFKGRSGDVRAIGRTLGVTVILEGSLRRMDDRVRITAQLVSAVDGTHFWSERYDRDVGDVFSLQDEIALAIARRLRLQLAGDALHPSRARQVDPEAHDLFLKGRFFLNRRHAGDHQRAIDLLTQSSVLDPDYAMPRVSLGEAFIVLGVWGFVEPGEAFGKARAAALEALELDPSLGDAHLVLALEALFHRRDRPAADREFGRAFELVLRNPVSQAWYGVFLIDQGRDEEALVQANAAVLEDPLSPMVHIAAGAAHLAAGRAAEARLLLDRALEFDPDSPAAHTLLGLSYRALGRERESMAMLRRAADAGVIMALSLIGAMRARDGQHDAAVAILDQLDALDGQRWVPFFDRALVRAALGETAASLGLLDRALENGEPVGLLVLGRLLDGLVPESWLQEVQRRSRMRRE